MTKAIRYGHPYIPDTSPLKLNYDQSCILRHLPTLDEIHFSWSNTEAIDCVCVCVIPGYGDETYAFNVSHISFSLRRNEIRLIPRAVGREIFNYLIDNKWLYLTGEQQ